MAYITQYDIDMKEQAREDANHQNLLSGVQNFANSFEQNRRRALDEKRQGFQEDLALSKMGATADEIKGFRETGKADGIFARHSAQAEAARVKAARDDERAARKDESIIRKNNAYESTSKKDPIAVYKEKLALKDEHEKGQRQESGELEVPGFGLVRSKEEAKTIRTALGDVETAKDYIRQIKELGTNVAVWDRDRIGKINQLKQALVGKLRLPLMGPGTMTEDEFQRTVNNLGDPGAWFGTEKNEIGKLDQMSGILDNNMQAMYKAAAKDSPGRSQSISAQAPQINPHVQQKLAAMTPLQKEEHYKALKAKQAASQGVR